MTTTCPLKPEVNEVKWNLIKRGFITLVLTSVVFVMMSMPIYASMGVKDLDEMDMASHDYILDRQQSSNCSMVQMNDNELSDVTASGFSSFTLQDDITKVYFNIEARTFTEIESLKMGYYNNGWDENWTNVSLGNSTTDLICKGLYIEAKFTNITNNPSLGTRTMDSIKIGTPSMTGPISATYTSFTGHIENPTDGVIIDAIRDGSRLNLGTRTITSTNSEFYMQLARTASTTTPAGWYFYWNNATITP
jgi:hypothetical protein